ncbi:MAG TPA: sigma-70 family RNA polymerase sigma factor [Polyangiales bacterium]|nr:sigma-70 family RNA polymerase sigma factor [Polyangiales bacterium]
MQFSPAPDPFSQLADLVHRERQALVGVATREGLLAEEALECVQDALCTWLVQRTRQPRESDAALVATLKHMVRNAARNWRRRHRRLKPHSPIDAAREPAADTADAERLLDAAEESLRLQVCVAELREVERAVVSLRLLEERSGEDVAAALGLTRAHVDVLVHRAKATLRTCMGAQNCKG